MLQIAFSLYRAKNTSFSFRSKNDSSENAIRRLKSFSRGFSRQLEKFLFFERKYTGNHPTPRIQSKFSLYSARQAAVCNQHWLHLHFLQSHQIAILAAVCLFYCPIVLLKYFCILNFKNNAKTAFVESAGEREKLIDLVEKNPQLWNPKLLDYMRTDKTDDLWKKLGSEMDKCGRT